MKTSILATLTTLLAMPVAVAQRADDLDSAFAKSHIVIEADEYACHHFEVYLAETWPQQRRGLMYVRELPPRTGMLFLYAEPGRRSMWMKNTYISLDMLFIRGDGTVESIARNTRPLSLQSISSGEPVVYVLELNAGTTRKLSIGTDSRIHLASTD